MTGVLIVGLIITTVCTVICARVSKAKGKNPTLYIVLGLLLPLIGLIVVLVMADDSKASNVVNNNVIANSQDSLKMDFPISKWYLDLPFEIVSNKIVVSNDKTKALLTLTMQNIGDKIIRSVYLKFKCFDDTYEKVCENNIVEYAYQDLEIAKNQLFGNNCIIELPSTTTRYVEIEFVKMAFMDGTVLREADINEKESLWCGELINDARCTNAYFQKMFGINLFPAKYLPVFTETKWLCTCGRTNVNNKFCVRCNRTKEQIEDAFSEKNISEYTVIAEHNKEKNN